MLTDQERMTNGILIPHTYDIKWARDLNKFLSQIFWCPGEFLESDSYLPSRTLEHHVIAELLSEARSNGIKRAFFANLEDFSLDFYKAGLIKGSYGILHGSNFDLNEPGRKTRFCNYEKGVASAIDGIFTASENFASRVPYKTKVIGLPILDRRRPPNTRSHLIVFNHRLNKEKNPMLIKSLPVEIQKRIVVTAPKGATDYVSEFNTSWVREFYLGSSDMQYSNILGSCGMGISFSSYDNFGYSVIDGVMHGLLYFMPDNDTTSYRELYPKEVRFSTVKELVEKIKYFDHHKEERKSLVNKIGRSLVTKFSPKVWLNKLSKEMCIRIPDVIDTEQLSISEAWK